MEKIRCAVPGCKAVPNKNRNLKFITFPIGEMKRKLWFDTLGLDFSNNSKTRRLHVCEQHFELEKDLKDYEKFKSGIGYLKLKDEVVPHLNLPTGNHNCSPSLGTSSSSDSSSQESSMNEQPVIITRSLKKLKPSDSFKCCVQVCGKEIGPDVILFKIPQVENFSLLNRAAAAKQRDSWLSAIGLEKKIENTQTLYICSDHFQSKKPAPLNCENDVDWKPTLLLERETTVTAMDEDVDPLNFVEVAFKEEEENEPPPEATDVLDMPVVSPTPDNTSSCCCNSASKVQILTSQLEESLLELNALKQKLADAELRQKEQQTQSLNELVIGELRYNDKLTKFYTGLKSWYLFTDVFNAVPKPTNDYVVLLHGLTKQQQFLMTLMRLRLNLFIADLGHRFHISNKTVSDICQSWVDLIFYQLPASNNTTPAAAKPMPDDEMSVEEKLRKTLKKTFIFLGETCPPSELYIKDKKGFSFIYKATHVCDYLLKMNNHKSHKT